MPHDNTRVLVAAVYSHRLAPVVGVTTLLDRDEYFDNVHGLVYTVATNNQMFQQLAWKTWCESKAEQALAGAAPAILDCSGQEVGVIKGVAIYAPCKLLATTVDPRLSVPRLSEPSIYPNCVSSKIIMFIITNHAHI